ncbi:hypothetical protein EEL32_25555 [Brevibacillus laterosporus]|nr:hypothetical protein [Brevibacillus laterosporus]TPG74026.1 hypothetical protein EEL32_25555 [Brevibacillus laterosporus]
MPIKFNDTGQVILVHGRMVAPGVFYEEEEEIAFVTTDGSETMTEQPELIDEQEQEKSFEVIEEKKITVDQMKKTLSDWGVDFSKHDSNKSTLYAFYVEEAKKRGSE